MRIVKSTPTGGIVIPREEPNDENSDDDEKKGKGRGGESRIAGEVDAGAVAWSIFAAGGREGHTTVEGPEASIANVGFILKDNVHVVGIGGCGKAMAMIRAAPDNHTILGVSSAAVGIRTLKRFAYFHFRTVPRTVAELFLRS